MHNFDVVIIGAGAAGLMCAAAASQRGRKVLLLDHARSVGEKIRISGGGRCNFTNLDVGAKNFISQNPHFCVSALKRFTSHDFINLVKKHQIAFHEKTLGQLFCDISSKEIIKMLLDECAAGAVEISLETEVTSVMRCAQDDNVEKDEETSRFNLQTSKGRVSCQSLVIATGGLSIPKMGATGFGYDVARQFGLKIIEPKAALVPFTFDENLLSETKNLAGVAADAIVSAGQINFREAVLFTHRGISGPAVLQISSYWQKGQTITINFAPQIDIFVRLQEEKKVKPRQEIQTFLAQFLPKNLADFFAKKISHSGNLADLSNQKIKEIADLVNRWSFIPSGTEGFAKAEVTCGGIDVNEISSKTFESKKVAGLFFIGEVLDVTGWLGGYNFQWAWASGRAAGEHI